MPRDESDISSALLLNEATQFGSVPGKNETFIPKVEQPRPNQTWKDVTVPVLHRFRWYIFSLIMSLVLLVVLDNTVWAEDTVGFEGYLALYVMFFIIFTLSFSVAPPALTFMFALTILLVTGVCPSDCAFQGFGNALVPAIGCLYPIALGIEKSTLLTYLISLIGKPSSVRGALARILFPCSLVSAFLNNTPLVAMLCPVMDSWGRDCGFSPRQLILPMNYAIIMGGMGTVVGTAPNLVVAGLFQEQFDETFSIFEASALVLVLCGVGIAYMMLCAQYLLPSGSVAAQISGRPFATSMEARAVLDGKTMRDSGVLGIPGLIVTGRVPAPVHHPGRVRAASAHGGHLLAGGNVSNLSKLAEVPLREVTAVEVECPSAEQEVELDRAEHAQHVLDERLAPGDVLGFNGTIEALSALFCNTGLHFPGYEWVTQLDVASSQRALYMVVIASANNHNNATTHRSNKSQVAGRSIAEVQFAHRFDAVVLAVRPMSGRHPCVVSLPNHQLRSGEVLLREAPRSFLTRFGGHAAFSVITPIQSDQTKLNTILKVQKPGPACLAAVIMLAIIGASSTGILSLAEAALLGLFAMLAVGLVEPKEVGKSISGSILVIVGVGFTIADVLAETGGAALLAELITDAFGSGPDFVLLVAMFLTGSLLSNIVHPAAVASLFYPILMRLPTQETDPSRNYTRRDLAVMLMVSSSCSYISPFSYQTNQMAAQAGGYEIKDFFRFGGPLLLIYMLLTPTLLLMGL